MTFYTVYRTQNLVNGKYYFGVHKTDNPYDGYLGSGTILKRAIAKHGEKAFIKNLCFIFDNPEEAFAKEFELIETYRGDPLRYNLRQGGSGGFDYINREGLSGYHTGALKMNKVLYDRLKTDSTYRLHVNSKAVKGRISSLKWRDANLKANQKRTGSKHRSDTIEKMRLLGESRVGNLNGRFGTKWMHNKLTHEVRCVKNEEIEPFKEKGWEIGRKV